MTEANLCMIKFVFGVSLHVTFNNQGILFNMPLESYFSDHASFPISPSSSFFSSSLFCVETNLTSVLAY